MHTSLTVNWIIAIFKILCVAQFWTHPNFKEQGETATAEEDYKGDSKSHSIEEVMIHQPSLEIKDAGRKKPYWLSDHPTPIPTPTQVLLSSFTE